MRKQALLVSLVLLGAAAASLAQETPPAEPTEAQEEEARPEVKRKIRVLENPYDISSFYRSRQSRGIFGYEETAPLGSVRDNPYAIAGYYRSRQQRGSGYGYSQFWAAGYGGPRSRGRAGHWRRIGAQGDLFLIAPFLAPVGPLSGAFVIDP